MSQAVSEKALNANDTVDERMVKLLTLLPKEDIKKGQNSIRGRLATLDEDIHFNAVQCMLHCEKHRDTSLMRRLLVDIIHDETGYRRQGLIAWMRMFSPMNLAGKDINLSGKDAKGNEKPFNCEKAAAMPFWKLTREVAIVKPAFRETFFSPVENAMRNFREAYDNTGPDGKPIDPKKPTFQGLHGDKVVDFFAEVEKLMKDLPKDNSREVAIAQANLEKALARQAG